MKKTMETKYFFQIKNKVHDASGIANTDVWWWEKINGDGYGDGSGSCNGDGYGDGSVSCNGGGYVYGDGIGWGSVAQENEI